MQGIQQMVTGASQVASSATSVASALGRPRTAPSTAGTDGASKTGTTTPTATGPAVKTITANDFLTLLVAEMKNQDPTQPTDPTVYVQQMVGVNSLQQLIGINQGITALDTATGATPKPTP